MFSSDCALAALLLTAPIEPRPDSVQTAGLVEWLRPSIVQAAVDAEVLDSREERFFTGQSHDPAGDLRELQTRSQALALAPPLTECLRFPDRKLINDLLAFNRAYRSDLLARLALDPLHAEELRVALAETEQLYLIWNALRDAQCEYYYVTVRRQALQQLRDLVGVAAFYGGDMPPHVPYWYFPVLR
jgi:hypothetical protein